MAALPLNDPSWSELQHRGGSAGDVPDRLAALLKDPTDIESFTDLWPYLCSEDTAYSAAYAAVPYVVQIAERLPPQKRFEHLFFVGYVAMCSGDPVTTEAHIPNDLVEPYRQATDRALHLIPETLLSDLDEEQTCYLLASAAALKGYSRLGMAINYLPFGCPECGAEVVKPS